jgi:redox-sensing transcriptional repressor
MKGTKISQTALARLPKYLCHLRSLTKDTPVNISATAIAAALDMGEVQVRKDLAMISDGGKPKTGYIVSDLIGELETFLGYNDVDDAVIVGAGKLGTALLNYTGFHEYGLNVVAAFDIDDDALEKESPQNKLFHISKFNDLCKRMKTRIGIITVPAQSAQDVCDMMVEAGILAILNFAPTHLKVPEYVLLENVNIAATLALLSKNLEEKLKNRQGGVQV